MKKMKLMALVVSLLLLAGCGTANSGSSDSGENVNVYVKTEDRAYQKRTVGDWKIAVFDDTQEAAILDYYGASEGELTVPAEIDGFPVTVIAKHALNNGTLSRIILPDTIVAIEEGAFFGQAITEITLSDNLIFIGAGMLQNCISLTSVVIPNHFTEIPEDFCSGCIALTQVTLPKNLQKIGKDAFMSTKIENIALPEGLEEIGDYAFASTSLKEVTIPGSVSKIGEYAFDCVSLEKVIVPGTVTGIHNDWLGYFGALGVEIVCEKDSPAFEYAKKKGINYRIVSE